MELGELRQMGLGDLRVKEREVREEVFRLRLKLATNQLDNRANYRKARRELARLLTVVREKELKQGATVPAGTEAGGDAATN